MSNSQNYSVRLLKRMLEAYSASGSEQVLANLLREEMTNLGFKARIDQTGNVIGETGETGPRILLCGHMDTVPGEIPVRLDGDLLYGRGAVDAKSSLAAMILGCAKAMETNRDFHGTVAGVVQEETSSAGIKALATNMLQFDMAVFGEPSGTSNIIIGYKGSLKLEVDCFTRGGHSSSPWLSKNSLEEAFRFWNRLQETVIDNDAQAKFSAVTGCVTSIASGGGANTIPSNASMQVDLRVPPGVSLDQLINGIEETRVAFQERQRDVRIVTRIKDQATPYSGDPDSLAVRSFRGAIRKVTGSEVRLVRKTGTSDMNLYAQYSPIPMIAYGPGDSTLDHTDDEHVSITEYMKCVEVYAAGITRFASMMHSQDYAPTIVG